MACPSVATLTLFLEGQLEPSTKDQVEEHCEHCEQCIRFLEAASLETKGPLDASDANDDWSFDIVDRIANRLDTPVSVGDTADESAHPGSFGDYELLEVIGRGGMGVVYKAHQRSLNRVVAVKMVATRFDNANLAQRFQLEAKSAARLSHSGIVPIYEVGQIGSTLYFSMAFYPSSTLANLPYCNPPNFRHAAKIMQGVAEAVHYAHQRGVIHRDLKPSNILLDHDGSPKVSDFGLAKIIDSTSDLTSTGEVLGTPSYMAPEQASGKATATVKSDVYGLGAIFYYLMSGRPPFSGDNAIQTLYQVVHEEPLSLGSSQKGIPADLVTIVHKCLAKRPEERYDSAADLAAELGRFLSGDPILARPLSPWGRLQRWALRNPALAAMTIAAVLFLTVGSAASIYFGLLAQNRAAEVAIINKELVQSAADSRKSAAEAEKQAALATQLAEVTTRVLEQTLYDLQEIVMGDPAQQEQRRAMLLSVLQGLDELDQGTASDPRLARSRATALYGLAEVVSQRGDEHGNTGATASKPYYQQAIQLFRNLHEGNANNPVATADLADALRNYGDMLAEAGQWSEAHTCFLEATELIETVAPNFPDDPRMQALNFEIAILLAETTRHTGNVLLAGQLLKATNEKCQTAHDRFPDHEYLHNELIHVLVQLGDWYRIQGELEKAYQCYAQMQTEAETIIETHGSKSSVLMDLSSAHERLGLVQQQSGKLEESLAEQIDSLRYAEQAGSLAPNNDHVQWDVSFSYQQVADAYLRLNRPADAIPMSEACSNIRRRLAQLDPSNRHLHYKLIHTLQTAATAHEKLADHEAAIECYDEIIRIAESFDSLSDINAFLDTAKQAKQRRANLLP